MKVAKSAWDYQAQGRNWVGGPRRATFTELEHAALEDEPKAFFLLGPVTAKLCKMAIGACIAAGPLAAVC